MTAVVTKQTKPLTWMDVKPAKTEKTEDVDQEVEDTTEDPNELLDIGQDNVDSSVWLVKVKATRIGTCYPT